MVALVPWQALIDLIEPYNPKTSSNGLGPPYPFATMLIIHLVERRSSLSDPEIEDALRDVPTTLRFAGIRGMA